MSKLLKHGSAILIGALFCVCYSAVVSAKVTAISYVIADAATGEILEAHNPHQKRQPASTTKLVTAMLVADKLLMDKWVKISVNASRQPRKKAYLKAGHQYRTRDLLKALLSLSANDAAVALAEAVAGSERKFAKLMTLKAKQCGAKNSRFRSAAGLTRQGQYSTAYDLMRIMQCARRYQVIRDYTRIRKTVITSNKGQRHTIRSHNRLFTQSPFYSIGKTGYTRAAKYTYVSYIKRNKQEAIIAMLGSNSLWKDANKLAKQSMKLAKWNDSQEAAQTRLVQAILKEEGYYHGGVDGVLGKNTKHALKSFQRYQKLSVDGKIGPATLGRLAKDSGVCSTRKWHAIATRAGNIPKPLSC